MFDDQLPRLGGLFALSQARGLDVRPTLLRVLTDLFVEFRQPSERDAERYAELAGHLVEQVDEQTRLAVARKLGPCRFAPRSVIDKLIASETEVGAAVIATSPLLSPRELLALATDGGPMTATAIASRPDVDVELSRTLARKFHPLVADALAGNAAAELDAETILLLSAARPEVPGLAARLAGRRDVVPAWLAPLFLDLDRTARASVLSGLRTEAAAGRASTRDTQLAAPQLVLDAIERAALSRNSRDVALAIADLLDVDGAVAARILADPSGEALAATLCALGMPGDQAARVLMFTGEDDGYGVERIRRLVAVVETLPRTAATRLVRAFTTKPASRTRPRHETVFAEPAADRTKLPAKRRESRGIAKGKSRERGRP